MKKHEIVFGILKIPLDFLWVISSFFLARNLRQINDFVPGVDLPIQIIENEFLLPFALFGGILYISIFSLHGLYNLSLTHSKVKETFDIILYSIYFFLFFSVFVFFGKGILYEKEIPRLVILFATFFALIGIIGIRIILNHVQAFLLERKIISKRRLLLISNKSDQEIQDILEDIQKAKIYEIIGYLNTKKNTSQYIYFDNPDVLGHIGCDEIIYIDSDFSNEELYNIWENSKIFGIPYRYITNNFDVTKTNTSLSLIHHIPVIEIKTTSLSAGSRVVKRIGDIFGSAVGLIVCIPLFILIGILIKIEDPSGPIIYKNRRVGHKGKEFFLYKFRYLKWKYCIKDSYGVKESEDEALQYEQQLIQEKSTRTGPLYKIKNDPRKTKIGSWIEKYSIDELPQLFNVLIGNMSLVGPRPHQPREVEKYEKKQKRVLTIKPGITGLAQVNGRENNSFEKEVDLDIFYIENRSFLLDIKIIGKTFTTILSRK